MDERVEKIVHQVKVPNLQILELFSKTERVLIHPEVVKTISDFVPVSSITINYLYVGEVKNLHKLQLLCYQNNVVPAHPFFLAADCLSRPAFNDSNKALTFWKDSHGLFCSAKFHKLTGCRVIVFSDSGTSLSNFSEKGDAWWLATVPK